jgi:hypothetical protein
LTLKIDGFPGHVQSPATISERRGFAATVASESLPVDVLRASSS